MNIETHHIDHTEAHHELQNLEERCRERGGIEKQQLPESLEKLEEMRIRRAQGTRAWGKFAEYSLYQISPSVPTSSGPAGSHVGATAGTNGFGLLGGTWTLLRNATTIIRTLLLTHFH